MHSAETIPSIESESHRPELGAGVLRKVAWRLLPFLCVLYLFNIIDRANVGFARVKMEDDLKMSPEAFSFGYGIFYFGYLVFEVPANLAAAPRRRASVDRTDHDLVGTGYLRDAGSHRHLELLWRPHPARHCRGRFLPRHRPVT